MPLALRKTLAIVFAAAFLLPAAASAQLVPQPDLWPFWDERDDSSERAIDHSPWQTLLDNYLGTEASDGVNRFDYANVSGQDKDLLDGYIAALAAEDPRKLNADEQQAYWINLYNAITVQLIIDNYPVRSIRRVNGGLFGLGPWNDDAITIQDQVLTLNDIEHRILRPIYQDARVHYAVNCASIGCPNLAAMAYTGQNLDELLTAGARAYVGHPRGVSFDGKRLRLSTIYKWFAQDFGEDEAGLLGHLAQYAEPELAERLTAYDGRIKYDYDWDLNEP